MDTETPRCGNCARFARYAGDRVAAVSMFGNCALLARWTYVSPLRGCRFDPSKWERMRDTAKPKY